MPRQTPRCLASPATLATPQPNEANQHEACLLGYLTHQYPRSAWLRQAGLGETPLPYQASAETMVGS